MKCYCYHWWCSLPCQHLQDETLHLTLSSNFSHSNLLGGGRLIFFSVLELPDKGRQKKTYFMLVLSTRVKIFITCGFMFYILLVKILKKPHWYLKTPYGKMSLNMTASYSTDPLPLCHERAPLMALVGRWCGCFQLLLVMWSSEMHKSMS